MKQARRQFIASSVTGAVALAALGSLRPIGAYAAQVNSAAAGVGSLQEAIKK